MFGRFPIADAMAAVAAPTRSAVPMKTGVRTFLLLRLCCGGVRRGQRDGLNSSSRRRAKSERSGAGPPLSYGFGSGHQVRDRRPADVDAIAERMRSVHRLRARDDVTRRVVDGHDAVD